MTTRDIINDTCNSQPEGMELLHSIKVNFNDVQSQYLGCLLMQKIVEIKLDMNKLKTDGYTLQEVLDGCAGIVHDEAERFVLMKLQQFVNPRIAKAKSEAESQEAPKAPQN